MPLALASGCLCSESRGQDVRVSMGAGRGERAAEGESDAASGSSARWAGCGFPPHPPKSYTWPGPTASAPLWMAV